MLFFPPSLLVSIKGQEEEKKRQIAHEYSKKDEDALRILKQSIKGVISRKKSALTQSDDQAEYFYGEEMERYRNSN